MALVIPTQTANDVQVPEDLANKTINLRNTMIWPGCTPEELMMRLTRTICQKYKLELSGLSGIQRKFLTHYRCSDCGLLPLYSINISHIKRVRCGKCGGLISFKRKGKYGKLRKDIALEITRARQEVGGA